jgi:transposase
MGDEREAQLSRPDLAEPALKVLQSMQAHGCGLTVFVKHAWVPMDNSEAERDMRTPVVGRKNFYGSGALWSARLAATMYSLPMTARLWKLNARTWLSAFLHACADNGNRAPPQLEPFLPWTMDEARLATMRAAVPMRSHIESIDSS